MDPDNLSTACHILAREWGSYGYRVDAIEPTGAGAGALSVHHADGSRFALAVDRWGCHSADATHDGTRASELAACAVASNRADQLHAAAWRARMTALSAD
jgi:hypothetical protein